MFLPERCTGSGPQRQDLLSGFPMRSTMNTIFLTNMKSVLESGYDLREDDMKRATQKFLVNM